MSPAPDTATVVELHREYREAAAGLYDDKTVVDLTKVLPEELLD